MKTIYNIFLLSCLIGLFGCTNDNFDLTNHNNEVIENNVRITVNVDNNATRTSWQEGESAIVVNWEEGDELLLTNKSGSLQGLFNVHIDDNGTAILNPKNRSFIIDDFVNEDIYAFYYKGYSYSFSDEEISFQNMYDPNQKDYIRDILWGIGEKTTDGVHFQMKHLCPILKIRVPAKCLNNTIFWNLNHYPSFNMNSNTYVYNIDQWGDGYSEREAIIDNDDYILYCTPTKSTEFSYGSEEDNWKYTIDFPSGNPEPGILYEYDLTEKLKEREEDKTYQSKDFSEDGKVVQLQKSTVGKGINLVFIGYGFVDKHMNPDGKYERRIKKEVERFFSIEPYKTFKNRFNVYMVKVVSKTCYWEGDWGSDKNPDNAIAFSYANKIPGLDIARVSVVHNNELKTYGRSYCTWWSDGSFVAYLFEDHPRLIHHEAGGHGFAHLGDEYVESTNADLTFTDYDWLDSEHKLGWRLNLDYKKNPKEILWSHFLQDERYEGEQLGVYEGAWHAGYGLYRPNENSTMRSQYYENAVYNAPSREQIYKQIMKLSEGSYWRYDYEKFVEYDAINRDYYNTKTRSGQNYNNLIYDLKMKESHREPIFVEGSWRDYIK